MNHRSALAGLSALAVTTGLTVGVVVGGSAPASAAPDAAPAAEGAAWLIGELDAGLLVGEFGPDTGLTIDAALALGTVGGHDSDVQAIADAVAANVDADNPEYNYVSGEAFDDTGSTYAGAVAKTLVLASAAGRDLTTFGGENFVTRLEGTVSSDPASAGRIVDDSSFGDNANSFGQAFAVRALDAAGSTLTDAATDYLLLQQCSEGFFRQSMGATTADTCDTDESATGSVDGTALAVLNLLSQADDTDVQAVIDDAVAWLVEVQRPDGSFGSDEDIPVSNANSTGLAGWALGQAGSTAAAEEVAVWLRGHQLVNTASCTPYADADLGAVAYDDAALEGGAVTDALRDQFRRGTAQALPALSLAPDGATSEITSASGFVRTGTTQRVPVAASPGDLVCLTGPGTRTSRRVDADGQVTFPVRMVKGTGNRSYRVEDGDEVLGTATFRVLGAKRFQVKAPAAAPRGRKVVLAATGLAPGEKATFQVRGEKRGTDLAGSKGRAVLRLRLQGKPGPVKVVVTGAFGGIRNGATSLRLTR